MKAYIAKGVSCADPLSACTYTTNHPKPALPSNTAVLVRVVYAGVNPADLQYVNGAYEHAPAHPMPSFPAPLGVEGAGIVVSVGSKVTRFKPGDQVLGLHKRMDEGTFAELASFEEHELAFKPPTMCWQIAAAMPVAGVTALSALLCCPALEAIYKSKASPPAAVSSHSNPAKHRAYAVPTAPEELVDAHNPIKSVLVLGASGGVGSFAVLLAKHVFNIPMVIATCSERNAEYVQQLGADITIDYACQNVQQSVRQCVSELEGVAAPCTNTPAATCCSTAGTVVGAEPNSRYNNLCSNKHNRGKLDLIIDNVGGSDNMSMGCQLLKPTGLYVTSVPLADLQDASLLSVLSFFVDLGVRKLQHKFSCNHYPAVAFNGARTDGSRVQRIANWLAALEPILHSNDACKCVLRVTQYDLADAGSALRAVQSKHVVGKLVLRVADPEVQPT